MVARNEVLDIDAAKEAFQSRTVANGLHDRTEGVGSFLEETRRVCVLWLFFQKKITSGIIGMR